MKPNYYPYCLALVVEGENEESPCKVISVLHVGNFKQSVEGDRTYEQAIGAMMEMKGLLEDIGKKAHLLVRQDVPDDLNLTPEELKEQAYENHT